MGRLPFIKELGMRETVSLKAAFGDLRRSHQDILEIPDFTEGIESYAEAGIGISNILRLFTVESIWRLTERNKEGVKPWGIRLKMNMSF